MLDGAAMRAEVASPTYLGGVWDHTGAGDPRPRQARRRAARRGDRAPACACTSTPRCTTSTRIGVEVLTAAGRVRARSVLLATSAYPPLLRAIRRYVVPVYDYVLVTEPLSALSATRSAGSTARASATAATSSTTTG